MFADGTLGEISSEQKKFVKIMSRTTNRIISLFDKVVLSVKVMTGKLEPNFAPVDLPENLQAIKVAMGPVAGGMNVTLDLKYEEGVICHVDMRLLKEALREVLENAIAASPSGGKVIMTISSSLNHVEISIKDEGKGIPTNELPTIFERFRWIGDVSERKTGGLGLGLFIARSIVELHQGDLEIYSVLHQGTVAKIRLPLQDTSVKGSA